MLYFRITKVLSCILTFTFLCLSGDVIPSSGSSGRVGRVDDGLQVGGDDDGDVDDEYHLDGGGVGESGRANAGKKGTSPISSSSSGVVAMFERPEVFERLVDGLNLSKDSSL